MADRDYIVQRLIKDCIRQNRDILNSDDIAWSINNKPDGSSTILLWLNDEEYKIDIDAKTLISHFNQELIKCFSTYREGLN